MSVQRTLQTSPAEDLIEALDELSLQIWVARADGEPWEAVDAPEGTAVDACFERLRGAMATFRGLRGCNGTQVRD